MLDKVTTKVKYQKQMISIVVIVDCDLLGSLKAESHETLTTVRLELQPVLSLPHRFYTLFTRTTSVVQK